jgi:hypothetical protein
MTERERLLAMPSRRAVWEAIRHASTRGLTDHEIEMATGLPGDTVRPRRVELARRGLVVRAEWKRPCPSGRLASVWVVEK